MQEKDASIRRGPRHCTTSLDLQVLAATHPDTDTLNVHSNASIRWQWVIEAYLILNTLQNFAYFYDIYVFEVFRCVT